MTDAQRETMRQELLALAAVIKWNIPNPKRPHDFHAVKSDAEHRLRKLARELEAQ